MAMQHTRNISLFLILLMLQEARGSRYGDPAEFRKLIVPLVISAIIFCILIGLLIFFYRKHVARKLRTLCACHGKQNANQKLNSELEDVVFDPSVGVDNVAFSTDKVAKNADAAEELTDCISESVEKQQQHHCAIVCDCLDCQCSTCVCRSPDCTDVVL